MQVPYIKSFLVTYLVVFADRWTHFVKDRLVIHMLSHPTIFLFKRVETEQF